MADIKDQLIKDSYNYVLQSDLSTGIVYRIGGAIPVNPIFSSGLTVNSGFTYSNGTEQPGYALLTDGTGYAYWGPISGASPSSGVTSITVGNGLSANSSTGAVTIVFTGSTSGDYLPLSGGTVTGGTIFQNGLTANTVSATTYQNLPVSAVTNGTGISATTNNGVVTITNTLPDQTVTISGGTGITTGGTYPNFTITNSTPDQTVTITGGTNIQISGTYPNFGVNFTGSTGGGQYLPLSGGTVTGGTIFQNGLTANTISATTYFNLPVTADTYVTGFTLSSNTITLSQNRNDSYSSFTISLSAYTGSTSITGNYLPLSGGTVTGNTTFTSGLTSNTISATTYFNLPVSGLTSGTGIGISNLNGNYTISYTGSSSGGLDYFVSASTPTGTIISGDRWFNTNTGVELVWIDDGDSQQWIQPFSVPGPLSPDAGYYTTTGITTGQTLTWDKTYWGISGNSNIDLVLPSVVGKEGYYLIIKDESGICGTYRIRITPSSGTIDNNNYVDMNINYMSLTCMVRGGNWYLI